MKIDVLDKGYVILQDLMGTDLTVVNAARVSYNKKTDVMRKEDRRLIKYLAEHGHTSPFRHVMMQFEIHAPLMVTRQWEKYIVGSDHTMDGRNESSRRYVTEVPEFYIPAADEWRSAPENSKQGSGDLININLGRALSYELVALIDRSERLYEGTMEQGVCAEQARLFLPAYGMYVRWYWTASLQSVCHFLNQRLDSHSQKEIQEYAKAVEQIVIEKFPVSYKELVK